MTDDSFTIHPIGVISSTLTSLDDAPRQGDEGAPEAWLELNSEVAPGLLSIEAGDDLFLLTWLHLADRDTLQVHPRDEVDRPLAGVFSTRSSDRPNPIGMHRVMVLEVAGNRLRVAPLEAIDGTPLIDIKPVLGSINER
jgi:tRNA-Thr(GGU) m(6)t(6)A37 methyltransferase TsaA